MIRRLAPLLLLSLPLAATAQPAAERHAEVHLLLPDGEPLARPAHVLAEQLAREGLVLDHARVEATARGPALRTVLSETELAAARASGATVEVLVEDLAAHYLATRGGDCQDGRADVSRITADLCGTMGGYLTFDGIVDALGALHAAHPEIVSAPASIGQSWEGREIWLVEISDNPGVDEGEPEVLYTSIHHAREPGSMMAVLYYMHYLAEQYAEDSQVRALLNNRRLFFVPVLNPDGYVYNETTNPDGGGFWRKNRRDNGDGSFGVDLNRNYGFAWGWDNIGSSTSPTSGTYRGPEAFSEPETAALRDFVEGRRIRSAFNYHTAGDLLLYPWGYTADEATPDDGAFSALGDTLTASNGYLAGQISRVLYLANGNSDDWMYGEQTTKPRILSFTPEVGYSFWPDPYDVYPLADENVEANLLLARFAGDPPVVAAEPLAPGSPAVTLEVTGPNPLRASTSLRFALPAPSDVRLAVFDALGREVALLAEGPHAAGPHAARFDAAGLAPGAYVVRLTTADGSEARRLTVTR